jgi:hypothetical protein
MNEIGRGFPVIQLIMGGYQIDFDPEYYLLWDWYWE